MQHYVVDRFGVGLLVRGCQHFLGPPTAGRGDVLHRMTLPLRRPLPPNRMPHPAPLRHDLGQPIRPAKPVIEQMTIARLGHVLRRREYRRLPDRRPRLRLPPFIFDTLGGRPGVPIGPVCLTCPPELTMPVEVEIADLTPDIEPSIHDAPGNVLASQ